MEGSRVLRERALDVVVDMLSDEIDAVRLAALEVWRALGLLSHKLILNCLLVSLATQARWCKARNASRAESFLRCCPEFHPKRPEVRCAQGLFRLRHVVELNEIHLQVFVPKVDM
jgi:hypothetical protein